MTHSANRVVEDCAADIGRLHDLSVTALYSLPSEIVTALQIAVLQERFTALSARLPVLARLAAEQEIGAIATIDDGAPLLFPHSLYKSYPASILDKGQFERLTRWLGGLTTTDLASVDTAGCETIDDWIDALDRQSEIRIIHSGGTTGKLSFLPRSGIEIARSVKGFSRYYEGFGDEPNAPLVGLADCPIIFPNYRRGAMGQARLIDGVVKHLYGGDESMVVALNPGRLSADMLSLAGRMRIAEAKGELGRIQIPPKLLARRAAFLEEQSSAAARQAAFFDTLAKTHHGRRVIIMGHWHQHYDIATAALKDGIENLFAPDSLMFVPGGMKGRALPAGFQDVVKRYLGIGRIGAGYGMSEVTSMTPSCAAGNFHLQPFIIPYVLDPVTGTPLPRSGVRTGRYGFIDLMAETYWGGFLTGDEVTIDWGDKQPCRCGRIGPFLSDRIRRYSEKEGGDDKITCAGAPDAHDKAVGFLTDLV